MEAYILVHKVGFSYSDVKSMVKAERFAYIKLLSEEVEKENDAIKRVRSNR